MGCDCVPQVADLFLYWYKHNYISREVENSNPAVYTLKFASRYNDDLNTPNISQDIVDIICNDIYGLMTWILLLPTPVTKVLHF